jgi:hypothetical protein
MAQLKIPLTDVIKAEYRRCAVDPEYFIRTYCKIEHPIKGLIKFDLYNFQADLLLSYQQFNENIILKSRQLGITTTTAGYAFWLMFFNKGKKIEVLATKQKVATNIINMVKVMYNELPSIKFNNKSQIVAESTTEQAGRSAANSLVIIDEAAFVPHFAKTLAAIQQTLATGGALTLLSTPNGQNDFFRIWTKSVTGENNFHRTQLKWNIHPERDQTWRDKSAMRAF